MSTRELIIDLCVQALLQALLAGGLLLPLHVFPHHGDHVGAPPGLARFAREGFDVLSGELAETATGR
jgi:hypothetical protein